MRGDLNGLVLVGGEWLCASVFVLFKKACQPLIRNACKHQLFLFQYSLFVRERTQTNKKSNCGFRSEYCILLISDIHVSLQW